MPPVLLCNSLNQTLCLVFKILWNFVLLLLVKFCCTFFSFKSVRNVPCLFQTLSFNQLTTKLVENYPKLLLYPNSSLFTSFTSEISAFSWEVLCFRIPSFAFWTIKVTTQLILTFSWAFYIDKWNHIISLLNKYPLVPSH